MLGTWIQQRYRLDTELGRGGMGVVYRAHDTLLGRDVAVKVLLNTAAQGSEGSDGHIRLLREAQATARLNHPNIVAIHDAGQTTIDGQTPLPYIVMELVEGITLREARPANIQEAIAIATQICAALAQAHANDIIHRDLKPENILLTPARTVKLMDFGLAHLRMATQLTAEGMILGTFSYLAPELIQGGAATEQSDLYALGVVLYEWVAGRPPFEGGSLTAVLSQHLFAPVVPPSTYNESISPALDHLIVELLAKTAHERPASAEGVWREFQNLAQVSQIIPSADVLPIERITRGRLVAREQELAEANRTWHKALDGEGQVLLISGEPGIGKTRLTQDLVVRAKANRALVLMGECYAEGGAPYAPIARIVEQILANYSASQLALADYVGNGLVTIAPALQAQFPHVQPIPLNNPQAEQQRLLDAVFNLFTAVASLTPILLVVDDVHWADSGSLALVRYLARRGRALPLLLVLTYREIELNELRGLNELLADFNRERLATRIKLVRLDMEQTRQLLATLFAEEVTPEFVQAIYQETEGNPFFVEEVCKALIDSGQVYREGGRWHRLTDMADMQIPQSVRMAIETRLANLPEAVQHVLRVAAVIGRKFPFDILVAISDLSEDNLIEALEKAERAQLIAEIGSKGGGEFSFTHALIPTALADGQSGLRRRRLHRQVAGAMQALYPTDYESLAYHYNSAGDDAQARICYGQAADRALAAFANQDAERYYRAGLEASTEVANRAPLLMGLANALISQSHFQDGFATYEEAIALYQQLGEYDQVALLYAQVTRAYWFAGNSQSSLAAGKAGLAAVVGQPETAGIIQLLHEVGRAYYFNTLPAEGEPLCERALLLAEQQGLVQIQAEAMITLAIFSAWPQPKVYEALQQASALASSVNLLETAYRAEYNYAIKLFWGGHIEQAIMAHYQTLEMARKMGRRHNELWAGEVMVFPLLASGRLQEAQILIDNLENIAITVPQHEQALARIRLRQIEFYRYQGQFEDTLTKTKSFLQNPHIASDTQTLCTTYEYMTEAALEIGATAEVAQFIPQMLEFGPKLSRYWAWILAISFYAQNGELDKAQHHLGLLQKHAEQVNVLGVKYMIAVGEARLAAANQDVTLINEKYSQLCELSKQLNLKMFHAPFLLEWAKVLHKLSASTALAHSLLEEALVHFTNLERSHYIPQVQQLLAELAN